MITCRCFRETHFSELGLSLQLRQSGLKSEGSWILVKKFRFFQAILKRILFSRKKIGHLHVQLLLGKLFYFSSKVTTFEHILPVHDKI